MDLGLLGAYLGAAKQGYDEQDYLTRRRQADDEQQARLKADDSRRAQTFSDQQADRAHMLERRPTIEQQEDDARAAQLKGLGLRNAIEQHTIDRQPTTDTQHDTAFDTEQQLRHAQIGNIGQEQALRNLQMQRERLGLDDATVDHATKVAQRGMGDALSIFGQTGNGDAVLAQMKKLHPGMFDNYDSPVLNQDGTVTVSGKGMKPQTLSMQDFSTKTLNSANPMSVVNSIYQHASAESDPKNWESIESRDRGLYEHNKITGTVRPVLSQGGQFYGHIAGKSDPNAPEGVYRDAIRGGNSATEAIKTVQAIYPGWSPGSTGSTSAQTGLGAAAAQSGAAPSQTGAPAQPNAQNSAPPARAGLSASFQNVQSGASASTPMNSSGAPQGYRQAADGNWYAPDPARPGKYVQWMQGQQ